MYELAQAEQEGNDEIFKVDKVTVLIEPIVVTHLDGDIVIDDSNYGFILKNSNEVLTYGMKVAKIKR